MEILHFEDLGDTGVVWLRTQLFVLGGYRISIATYLSNVKLELVRTLLRITRLVLRKSHLVIICPNAHEKLTKSENIIRSRWSRFEHCS